jgi:hypothetical protein
LGQLHGSISYGFHRAGGFAEAGRYLNWNACFGLDCQTGGGYQAAGYGKVLSQMSCGDFGGLAVVPVLF